MSSQPVKLLIVGAGNRGQAYARFVKANPERAKIVGVAEPRAFQRQAMAEEHQLPEEACFSCWKEAAQVARMADAVIIATQDHMHVEPVEAFAAKGYNILLEKPMAQTEADCQRIEAAVKKHGVMFALCYVLRYTTYTQKLKALLDEGRVGDIISIQHLEPVGYLHQAHSFVRGNWRNEKESCCMLLAKSCHDIDWMHYILGGTCERVSSFGGLHHFRKEHKPAGASDRCLTCEVEAECPYSAKRFYFDQLEKNNVIWPLSIVTDDISEQGITKALEEGPYGRCVYECDNDVVDHQVVNMEYAGNVSVTFTMTAFTGFAYGRTTRIFGSRGEIFGDSNEIKVKDFLTGEEEVFDTNAGNLTAGGGHGGGDGGLMDRFITALAEKKAEALDADFDDLFASHKIVFAAEKARRERRVVELP